MLKLGAGLKLEPRAASPNVLFKFTGRTVHIFHFWQDPVFYLRKYNNQTSNKSKNVHQCKKTHDALVQDMQQWIVLLLFNTHTPLTPVPRSIILSHARDLFHVHNNILTENVMKCLTAAPLLSKILIYSFHNVDTLKKLNKRKETQLYAFVFQGFFQIISESMSLTVLCIHF